MLYNYYSVTINYCWESVCYYDHCSVSFIHQSIDSLLNLILTLSIKSWSSFIKDQNFWIFSNTSSWIYINVPIAILCFWPPDSLTPLSPTRVSKCSGKSWELKINSLALAISRALLISKSWSKFYFNPYSTFYLRFPEKRVGSCETNPILYLNSLVFIYLINFPLIKRFP